MRPSVNDINIITGTPRHQLEIAVTSGVEPAEQSKGYASGAFIPRKRWELLDRVRYQKGDTDNYCNYRSIYVGKLPEEIIATLQAFDYSKCSTYEDVVGEMKRNYAALVMFNHQINLYFEKYLNAREFNFHRISVHPPDTFTLTYKEINEKKEYCGLHFDRSVPFDIFTAKNSPDRVAINLNGDRYLLFSGLSLERVHDLLSATGCPNITIENISELYREKLSDYPVYRLKLPKYYFYIAPTDNFFHDGSCMGQLTGLDISMHYIGNFSPRFGKKLYKAKY